MAIIGDLHDLAVSMSFNVKDICMNEFTYGKYYLAYGGYITFPVDGLEAVMLRAAGLIGKWNEIEVRQYVAENNSRLIAVITSKARRKEPVFIPEWEPESGESEV